MNFTLIIDLNLMRNNKKTENKTFIIQLVLVTLKIQGCRQNLITKTGIDVKSFQKKNSHASASFYKLIENRTVIIGISALRQRKKNIDNFNNL